MTNNWSLQEKKLKKDYTVEKGTEKCLFLKNQKDLMKNSEHTFGTRNEPSNKKNIRNVLSFILWINSLTISLKAGMKTNVKSQEVQLEIVWVHVESMLWIIIDREHRKEFHLRYKRNETNLSRLKEKLMMNVHWIARLLRWPKGNSWDSLSINVPPNKRLFCRDKVLKQIDSETNRQLNNQQKRLNFKTLKNHKNSRFILTRDRKHWMVNEWSMDQLTLHF